MRVYTFFSTMLLAGVVAVSANAQSMFGDSGQAAPNAASDMRGNAQMNADAMRGAAEDARLESDQRRSNARQQATESLRNTRDGISAQNDASRAGINYRANANQNARFNETSYDANQANLTDAARADVSSDFTDADRTADWRFVQRDGAWWYRTPMNTWMVQQNGQWVSYNGDPNQGFANQDAVAARYQDSGNQYNDAQAQYTQAQRQQQYAQQSSYQGENHPAIGTQEWMCIDGQRRLVTVVSVRTVGAVASTYQASPADQDLQRAPEAPQRYTAARALTPPPAPAPNVNAGSQHANHPQAPSRDAILQADSATGLNNQPADQSFDQSFDDQSADQSAADDYMSPPPEPVADPGAMSDEAQNRDNAADAPVIDSSDELSNPTPESLDTFEESNPEQE